MSCQGIVYDERLACESACAGGGMGSAAEAAASIQQRRNYGAKPVGLMTKRAGAKWCFTVLAGQQLPHILNMSHHCADAGCRELNHCNRPVRNVAQIERLSC